MEKKTSLSTTVLQYISPAPAVIEAQWHLQQSISRSILPQLHESFMAFNFADVTGYLRGKRKESFIRCERSFIPMKLIQLAYLVIDLGNRVMKLCIETGLRTVSMHGFIALGNRAEWISWG